MRNKLTLILFVWFFISTGSFIFSTELGIKAGIIHSHSLLSKDLPRISYEPISEFTGGVFFSMGFLGNRICFQPEVWYTKKGFDAVETYLGQDISSIYQITYFEIPLLLSYKIFLKGRFQPGIVVGPYYGTARKVTEIQTAFGETETKELGNNLKKPDLGFIFGSNIKYSLGSFNVVIDARYHLGLTTISQDMTAIAYEFERDDTIKNRAWSFSLGLSLNLKKTQ
jgi:hypothetical protein